MKLAVTQSSGILFLLLSSASHIKAFAPQNSQNTRHRGRTVVPSYSSPSFAVQAILSSDAELMESLDRQLDYKAGAARTDFATKYQHLVGKPVRTVGEAFTEFTTLLGKPVQALYKGAVTDLVGTTHLITVDARFRRDAIWSLGLLESLDLILKNYPEGEDVAKQIVSSLLQCTGLKEEILREEASHLVSWCEGKSRQEIATAFSGDGDSLLAEIARTAKADDFWMYSRYFGIGLIKMMDLIGLRPDQDSSYEILEEWMSSMGKSHYTASSDSDLYFKTKSKLEMMEMMMKEIEIREKKRMAVRLEEKAVKILEKAERDARMKEEIEMESIKKLVEA